MENKRTLSLHDLTSSENKHGNEQLVFANIVEEQVQLSMKTMNEGVNS
jgi:hypothetical protein